MTKARGTARRVAAAAATIIAAELGTAAPASAHTVGGVPPTDYESQIVGLAPPTPGISARLLDLGRRIQLTNTTRTDVVVIGYQSEAYLRIGPAGVFENIHSPAVYQNRLVAAGAPPTTLPAIAQPTAAPQWQHISTSHTATWRDRRTRWEGPRPPAVQQDPHRVTAVADWVIPLRLGAVTVNLAGRILWVPPPDPLPWLGLALLLILIALVVGRSRWWGYGLSTLLALAVASDIARSYAAALISGGSVWIALLHTLVAGGIGFAFWGLGALSVALLQQEREGGLVAGACAGLGIGLLGGVTDLPYLLHSQVPVAAPPTIARAGISVVVGLGLGLAIACVLQIRRLPPRQ